MSEPCRVCPTRLLDEASRIVGTSFSDIVPPEAQRHLLAAQREFLLAVAATIEYHTQAREPEDSIDGALSDETAAPRPRRGGRSRGAARSRRPAPVELE